MSSWLVSAVGLLAGGLAAAILGIMLATAKGNLKQAQDALKALQIVYDQCVANNDEIRVQWKAEVYRLNTVIETLHQEITVMGADLNRDPEAVRKRLQALLGVTP